MHESVLLEEAITSLHLQEDSIAVDMTLGFAGHSSEILKRVKKGYLFAFDQDEEAIAYSKQKLAAIGSNFEIIDANFANCKIELAKRGITQVNAILYDLGVSSPQLDRDYRGFSYHQDAILDMRMDHDNPLTAEIVVNTYTEQDLQRIFWQYGESKYAKAIAHKIVTYRKQQPITHTLELVDIIKSAVPIQYRLKKHPAKQIFQAIRMEVNHELDVLATSLQAAFDLLAVNGYLAVITFHSLEDRMVKQLFKQKSEIDPIVKGMPNIPPEKLPDFKLITTKGIKPSAEELDHNPRSHSATLRVIQKIK